MPAEISEAATKLVGVAEELCPDVPWARARAIGNMLRHEYDRIDSVRIWFLIERNLPSLKTAAESALRHLAEKGES